MDIERFIENQSDIQGLSHSITPVVELEKKEGGGVFFFFGFNGWVKLGGVYDIRD